MSKPPANPLNDFADWISPMLVKELRQGMRTKVFVITFIALQVLMTMTVVVGLLAAAGGADPQVLGGFFWMMVGVPLLVVLPFAALGALSGEMKANTLELVFLTRLSAWRIVWGKWVAILAQMALFVCAILPYVVLRYFIGGVNLGDDLRAIGLMVLAAAAISAAMVGISPYQSRVARVVLGIGILFLLQLAPMLFFTIAGPTALAGGFDWKLLLVLPAFVALFIPLMLQIGAGRIAPPAENHSAAKRLLGLGFVLLALGAAFFLRDARAVAVFSLLACVPILVGAICEPEQWNPGIFRPFVRRGLAGRVAGRLFYAGWPAGQLFAVVLLGLFAWLFGLMGMFDEPVAIFRMIAFAGTFLFGAAVFRLFLPRTDKALGIFIAMVGMGGFIAALVAILDRALEWNAAPLLALYPPSALALGFPMVLEKEQIPDAIAAVSITTIFSLAAVLFTSLRAWRRMKEAEDAVRVRDDGMA